MSLITIALLAACTVASALIFLGRITTWRSILKYRAGFDVIFTIGMFAVFAGTLGGALVATIAGLLFSATLGIAATAKKKAKHIHHRNQQF